MKLAFRDIESFVKHPPQNVKAVLIYGPDQGLVKERSKIIAKGIVDDINDPFNVIDLDNDSAAANPERLADEANSMSMLGGRRLIRVKQADDKITQSCKNMLEIINSDNMVIIESDNLGPKSALRLLFEKAKNAAALPCYVEDGRNLSQTIRDILGEFQKTADRDATAFLQQNLQGDRILIRSELEKLALYAGKNPTITLNDCLQAIGQQGDTGFNDIVFAVASGDLRTLDKKLNQAYAEGFPPQALLRSMQNHIKRIYTAKIKLSEGMNPKEAMESITPKVFWKEQDSFHAQMNRWSEKRLEFALMALMKAEIESKTSHIPAETIASQIFFKIGSF